MSERPKRPGTMSDADRALLSRDLRMTPSRGLPIHVPADDDFTPVSNVLERISETFVPTERERILLHLVWQHTANIELRARERYDGSDSAAIVEDLTDLRTSTVEALADIRGASGNNGKIGALKARVDALSAKAWWVLTAAVGGIGAAAAKLVLITSTFQSVADRSHHNAEQIRLLHAQVQTLQSALFVRDLTPETP